MRKYIAVDAEVLSTRRALIAATFADSDRSRLRQSSREGDTSRLLCIVTVRRRPLPLLRGLLCLPLCLLCRLFPCFLRAWSRRQGKWRQASKAPNLFALACLCPGHLNPAFQREEMVIGARQVGAQDQGETTGWAFSRQPAHFGATARAEVSLTRRSAVAGTEGDVAGRCECA